MPVEAAANRATDHEHRDRLRRVFDRAADGLFRFILVRVGGDRTAAEELLAESCCVAARSASLPEEDEACEAWWFGVARNLIRAHWRCAKRRPSHVSIESLAGRELVEAMEREALPVDRLMRDETVACLLSAITALPSGDQRIVLAHYFEERSQADIAADLDVTVKSVETRLYRIRGRLRAILRNSERNEP
jgi:RNA polymerase sigma-70 factor (ECF subfamily)